METIEDAHSSWTQYLLLVLGENIGKVLKIPGDCPDTAVAAVVEKFKGSYFVVNSNKEERTISISRARVN